MSMQRSIGLKALTKWGSYGPHMADLYGSRLGSVAITGRDFERAVALYEQCLGLARNARNELRIGLALGMVSC